jgi:hypothetical protein
MTVLPVLDLRHITCMGWIVLPVTPAEICILASAAAYMIGAKQNLTMQAAKQGATHARAVQNSGKYIRVMYVLSLQVDVMGTVVHMEML